MLKKFNWYLLLEIVGITGGVFFVALGLVFFLLPNQIAAGGVSGLAIIIYYWLRFPMGLTMLILNIPIFIIGLKVLGISLVTRSIYAIFLLSFFVELLQPVAPPLTADLLLASIYGGVLIGLGLGIIFRFRGTTGGTDMSARLVNYYSNLTAGQALLIIDGIIVIIAGLYFNIEVALYAIVTIFIVSKTIDIVQEGPYVSRMFFIISKEADLIKKKIIEELDRGLTVFEGAGGYTGEKRKVLVCIIARSEVSRLKKLVSELDAGAFVIITSAHEVLGEGFRDMAENLR